MSDMPSASNSEQYRAAMPDTDALRPAADATDDPSDLKWSWCPQVLVIDGAEPACRLLRSARDQLAQRCLIIYVQQRPSCVVMDLDVHGSAALEVCRIIRAEPDAIDATILWMTEHKTVGAFDAALLAGADEILLKPFPDAELIARVESALKPNGKSGSELRRRCERLCKQRALLEAEGARTGG